jgi:cytidylate kinase
MAILTISRELGSGGSEIGHAVAEILGYNYIDKDTLQKDIAAVGGKWGEWGDHLDERCPTVWEKYDWSFRGYGALIQKSILNHALGDRAVIMGRGGNFILKGVPHALRVRITAPLESRVARIVARESIDPESARWLIEKTDRSRSCFLYSLYGKHWDDPAEYDFVLMTGYKPLDHTVSNIVELLKERDELNTDEARQALRMQTTAANVKAGLLTNPHIFVPLLDVKYTGREIVLRGVIHNPEEHKRIEDLAGKLAEGLPLRCELQYRG